MNSTINLADCADIVNCENRMSGIGTADVLLVVVGMGLIAVWMVMLPIALWSVVAEPTGTAVGVVWALVIVGLPFIGAIAFWVRNRRKFGLPAVR